MSIGKMTTFIDIIEPRKIKDSSGFVTVHDVVLSSVRAYKEERHASRAWANRAVFSKATIIFQFRKIPDLEIKPDYVIVCDTGRYRILSAEDVQNRKMYTEALCDKAEINGTI